MLDSDDDEEDERGTVKYLKILNIFLLKLLLMNLHYFD